VEKRETPDVFKKRAETKKTFNQLAKWYLKLEKVKALASHDIVKINLNKFNKVFGDQIITSVIPADLENYQMMRKRAGAADATIDHEIGKAKTMIIKAFDNELVSGNTLRKFKGVGKMLKKGSDVRDRILSKDEFDAIVAILPRHAKPVFAMGYYAGMRRGEILNLTWDKVDLKGRMISLEAADTKDDEARHIPICEELYTYLAAIPRAIHVSQVFLYKGQPFRDIRAALRNACTEVGVNYGRFEKGGFVFHDLRHTFNTNMRKAGVAESVIMAITGHSTREMFDRYNTVDVDDLKDAVGKLTGFVQNVNQSVKIAGNGN